MKETPKVLHLTLKKKWFDMIASGEKKEEYREIKNYWMSRILTPRGRGARVDQFHWVAGFYAAKFNVVQFRNGYGPHVPQMTFKVTGVRVDEGKPEWGAEPGKKYYVIKLGERID